MMEAPAPSGEKTAPGNIFVVDDDPETVAFIRAVLSEGGHRVETATDPRVFLNKEVPFVPDVILLDVMMPEMSGIEVMEKIKKSCTERGIRLVTVSALSGEADIENAYRAGADDYIVKPFETGELLLRVERQLRIREREAARKSAAEGPPASGPPAAAPAAGRAAPIPQGPRAARAVGKILAIDDDPDVLRLVESCMSARGHTVLVAECGEDGILLAEREEPDLIVLDVIMPRMDGYEVCRKLAEKPHTAFIPILMLTAKGGPEDAAQALASYADEYVTKPFNSEELAARAEALIRRTQTPTRDKREQGWLIHHLAERAERRGHPVYSRHLSKAADYPLRWDGPQPDLIIQRGGRFYAYLIESVESLYDERTIGRWRALEERKDLQIHVIGQSKETARLAGRIKKENGFRARVRWMRPRQTKEFGWKKDALASRRAVYIAMGVVVLILSILVSGIIPNLWDWAAGVNPEMKRQFGIYQPRDAEREIRELKKEVQRKEESFRKGVQPEGGKP